MQVHELSPFVPYTILICIEFLRDRKVNLEVADVSFSDDLSQPEQQSRGPSWCPADRNHRRKSLGAK